MQNICKYKQKTIGNRWRVAALNRIRLDKIKEEPKHEQVQTGHEYCI
jgi:hypothetical protein